MGTIRRQSIQATFVLGAGVLLGFVLKLFIFTEYLTQSEIGLLTVLLDAANLFAAFIPLGSQNIFIRYLPHFRESGRLAPRGLLLLGSLLSLIGFGLFTGVFMIFRPSLVTLYSEQAPLFADYIIYLLPLVLFRVVFLLTQSYARALKKNVFPLIIKEVIVRILTGIIVIAYAIHTFDLDGLVLFYVLVYFISGAIMTWYISRQGFLEFSHFGGKLKMGKGREIFYFGLFAILTSTGSILIKYVDSVMITSIEGLAANGVYAIAFFIGQIIEMPRRAVSQITGPFVAEAAARNDQSKIAILYHKSAINQFIIGSIMLICVWTNIDNLFDIIRNGDAYRSGKYVVLFIGLGKLFDMSMGVNGNIIQNSPHYRFNFYSTGILGVLVVVTNLLLIPKLGINGAAIATLISIFAINLFKGVFINIKFGLQPFTIKSLYAAIIALLTYLIASNLPELNSPYFDLLYRSSISIVIFTYLILQFRVSKDFIDLYIALINRIKRN